MVSLSIKSSIQTLIWLSLVDWKYVFCIQRIFVISQRPPIIFLKGNRCSSYIYFLLRKIWIEFKFLCFITQQLFLLSTSCPQQQAYLAITLAHHELMPGMSMYGETLLLYLHCGEVLSTMVSENWLWICCILYIVFYIWYSYMFYSGITLLYLIFTEISNTFHSNC